MTGKNILIRPSINLKAIASIVFGLIQCLIGQGNKLRAIGQNMISCRCNAQADCDEFRYVRRSMGYGKPQYGRTDTACQDCRALAIRIGKNDHKFLPTISRHDIRGAFHYRLEGMSNLPKACIALKMTIMVSVFFEMIDIKHD